MVKKPKQSKQRKIKYTLIVFLIIILALIIFNAVTARIHSDRDNNLANEADIAVINNEVKSLTQVIGGVDWVSASKCEHVQPAQFGAKDWYYCNLSYETTLSIKDGSDIKNIVDKSVNLASSQEYIKSANVSSYINFEDSKNKLDDNDAVTRYGSVILKLDKNYSKTQNCALEYKLISINQMKESVVCIVETEGDYTRSVSTLE